MGQSWNFIQVPEILRGVSIKQSGRTELEAMQWHSKFFRGPTQSIMLFLRDAARCPRLSDTVGSVSPPASGLMKSAFCWIEASCRAAAESKACCEPMLEILVAAVGLEECRRDCLFRLDSALSVFLVDFLQLSSRAGGSLNWLSDSFGCLRSIDIETGRASSLVSSSRSRHGKLSRFSGRVLRFLTEGPEEPSGASIPGDSDLPGAGSGSRDFLEG